ncbi:MAG: amidohydrolase [Chloroflexi bacterium]|nr:amidohydrolase [Chloroflexota bacterium]
MSKNRHLSRRDFLKASALAVGGAILACGKGEQFVELTATVVPTPAIPPPSALAPGEFADTILVNGNLITVDSALPSAQALAIKGDRILQVGADAAIRALAGETTQIIDLAGKTVTPGLIDAHNHLQVWGTLLNMFEPLLPPEVRSLDDLLAKLADAVAKVPAGEWVQGYFWNVTPLPTRYDLDKIAPENPIWLMQQGGHYGITNSLGLQIAGITAETANPVGGVIQRDANGEPTGAFYNHRAMDLVRSHAPQPGTETTIQNIQFAEGLMAALGVTTYHDCNARFSAIQGYLQAGRDQSLLLRGDVFYTLEWPGDLQRALEEIQYDPDAYMRFAGYKFLIDGQNPTWYTHEPHAGISWNMPTWDPKNFKKAIRQLHDTGLQIAVHCGGDAAFDLTLDAYEEAMNANPRPDPRHRIEHGTLTKPESTQRAADLGVQISTQPQFVAFANMDKAIEMFGEERVGRMMVTREWLDAGINVALGSDTPTSPWQKPQVTLLGAVRRRDNQGRPFHPEQELTIQEALYAHTMGSAHAAFEEDVKGSLTPGKYADLVVWSGDFYTVADPMDIVNIEAELTMIGGKVVHQI